MADLPRTVLTFIGLIWMFNMVSGVPPTTFMSDRCSTAAYGSGDPYGGNVAYVLEDMVIITVCRPDYGYYTQSPFPTAIAYGTPSAARRFLSTAAAHFSFLLSIKYLATVLIASELWWFSGAVEWDMKNAHLPITKELASVWLDLVIKRSFWIAGYVVYFMLIVLWSNKFLKHTIFSF